MSDVIDMYRDLKAWARDKREALGVNCPNCRIKQPKRTPTILLPQQRCKVDGYRDPRPESLIYDWERSHGAVISEPHDDVPNVRRGG